MKKLIIGLTLAFSTHVMADSIILQSTTSTYNSGFYDYILPKIEEDTGVQVNVVAVGTGQAISNAMRCDGDVLLVHAKAAEEEFIAGGYGEYRRDLMYNDFVIIGPQNDPANISNAENVLEALALIAESGEKFASRGDDSGTHKKELSLWSEAAIEPASGSGQWYIETGSGMGATLNTGIGLNAYVLTDRATWLKFENKQDAVLLFEGDEALFNQYGVIPVSAEKCPSVNKEAAELVAAWLLSEKGQAEIASYQVGGKPLFFPNAN